MFELVYPANIAQAIEIAGQGVIAICINICQYGFSYGLIGCPVLRGENSRVAHCAICMVS